MIDHLSGNHREFFDPDKAHKAICDTTTMEARVTDTLRLPVVKALSWRGFRPVWNSPCSVRPVWGTEGREFKSCPHHQQEGPETLRFRAFVVLGARLSREAEA